MSTIDSNINLIQSIVQNTAGFSVNDKTFLKGIIVGLATYGTQFEENTLKLFNQNIFLDAMETTDLDNLGNELELPRILKTSAIVTGVATAFALNPLLGVGAVALAAGVLAGATALANNDSFETPSTGGLGFPSGFKTPTVSSNSIPTVPNITAPQISGLKAGTKAVVDMGNEFVGANYAVNTSSLAGIAAASGSSNMSGPINVTVNGAIDAEGTARTIVNTLNDSFYRGTGGATAFRIEK